jgi:hypothetical protein
MKSMRKIALAAFAMIGAGCSSGPPSTTVPFADVHASRVVPPVPDRHPYGDVTQAKVGQWVRYKEVERVFTIAAVAKEGDDVWIEVIDEGDDRHVSARLVAPDGSVKKALFSEVAKDGVSKPALQPLEQAPPSPRAPDGLRETGEEKVKVGDRELAAKVVHLRFETLQGRLAEEVTLWHPEVPPLYAGSPDGGLISRRTASSEILLLAFGSDAKPLIAPQGK